MIFFHILYLLQESIFFIQLREGHQGTLQRLKSGKIDVRKGKNRVMYIYRIFERAMN